ncbi:MAG: outer membrane lipoprotein carrier protein LolA [Actinomycetota bacterium]|nr:outer membrane lipoprotein carrier protein LolA [Actinomycetota bacterium]
MKLATAALAAAAAGAIGLGVLTMPAGAKSDPALPPVSAEDLVASMLTAKTPAFGGTVTVDNALGLPALPGMSPGMSAVLTQPETTLRVWYDGQDHGRLALPSRGGEQVLIEDGTTLWRYDSAQRTATALEHGEKPADQRPAVADPAQAARELVGAVRESSTVTVDGTGYVAGRPVYQLVLAPAPTERTLLREVRVAVDLVLRVPLQLTVLADGSTDPALQVGFSDLNVGTQDPALFQFTPPAGVTVERFQPSTNEPKAGPWGHLDGTATMVRTEGDGWDTVVLGQLPPARPDIAPDAQRDPLAVFRQIGRPASGPWGNGWVVQTAVATVMVTSDRRVAAGAVPQQVLDEALTR